jgi:hypothetical protein
MANEVTKILLSDGTVTHVKEAEADVERSLSNAVRGIGDTAFPQFLSTTDKQVRIAANHVVCLESAA